MIKRQGVEGAWSCSRQAIVVQDDRGIGGATEFVGQGAAELVVGEVQVHEVALKL